MGKGWDQLMVKKLLIGCALTTVVVTLLVVGVVVYIGYRVNQSGEAYQTGVAKLIQLNTDYPYTKPPDGKLDPVRLKEFFEVRDGLAAKIREHSVGKALLVSGTGAVPVPGVGDIVDFGLTFGPEVVDEAGKLLEARKMSPDEYKGLVATVLLTVKKEGENGDAEYQGLLDQLAQTTVRLNKTLSDANQKAEQLNIDLAWQRMATMQPTISPENAAAVRMYLEKMKEIPAMAFVEMRLASEPALEK